MKVYDIINRLSEEADALPEIIAPILTRNGRVRIVISNHPYTFITQIDKPGWYILQPTSSTQAVIIREAEPFEIQKCLQKVPGLKTISVRRLASNSWLVFPYNLSDAKSRGFKQAPQECYLIDRNLEPFMTIRTRSWAGQLVFDAVDLLPCPTEYRVALEKQKLEPPVIKGVNPEFRMVYSILTEEIKKAREKTVEGRIKNAIEYLGAELIGYSEQGEGYSVEWRDDRQTYRTRIGQNLRLLSAGICLDGLEHEQTLASTVAVMRRSQERGYDDYED